MELVECLQTISVRPFRLICPPLCFLACMSPTHQSCLILGMGGISICFPPSNRSCAARSCIGLLWKATCFQELVEKTQFRSEGLIAWPFTDRGWRSLWRGRRDQRSRWRALLPWARDLERPLRLNRAPGEWRFSIQCSRENASQNIQLSLRLGCHRVGELALGVDMRLLRFARLRDLLYPAIPLVCPPLLRLLDAPLFRPLRELAARVNRERPFVQCLDRP